MRVSTNIKNVKIFPYLLVLPALALIIIFKMYPIVLNIWVSLRWKDSFSIINYFNSDSNIFRYGVTGKQKEQRYWFF